jgi:excisionase family DNA binding protein
MNAPTGLAQPLAGHPALLLPSEVATLLRCSEWWVKEQARNRRIPHTRVGGGYRFTDAHVAAIVRRFEVLPVDDTPVVPVTTAAQQAPSIRPAEPVTVLRARTPRRALRGITPSSAAA